MQELVQNNAIGIRFLIRGLQGLEKIRSRAKNNPSKISFAHSPISDWDFCLATRLFRFTSSECKCYSPVFSSLFLVRAFFLLGKKVSQKIRSRFTRGHAKVSQKIRSRFTRGRAKVFQKIGWQMGRGRFWFSSWVQLEYENSRSEYDTARVLYSDWAIVYFAGLQIGRARFFPSQK